VAVVQYTFTHKQYTEYRERNIHNNETIKRRKKLGEPVIMRPGPKAGYTVPSSKNLTNVCGSIFYSSTETKNIRFSVYIYTSGFLHLKTPVMVVAVVTVPRFDQCVCADRC
jgi:hypothetical protein